LFINITNIMHIKHKTTGNIIRHRVEADRNCYHQLRLITYIFKYILAFTAFLLFEKTMTRVTIISC